MEASTAPRISALPTRIQPDVETFKWKLLHTTEFPTTTLVGRRHGKVLLKPLSQSKSFPARNQAESPLSDSQMEALAEEFQRQTLYRERRGFTKAVKGNAGDDNGVLMLGKPWERLDQIRSRELSSASEESTRGKLKAKYLGELGDFFQQRRDEMRCLLGEAIETRGPLVNATRRPQDPLKRRHREADAVQFLIDKLSGTTLSIKDWKFSKMMEQSGFRFNEGVLLRIVGGLGANGRWKHALSVVEWVYSSHDHRYDKSRFVFTKLLAVLGKARRPDEALRIFNLMREDYETYPDMPAYRCIAVTLGQAGLLRPLLKIIECMREKPSKEIKNVPCRNWDPSLQPDLVVFNAVLNACIPLQQWRGAFWVFKQMRKTGLNPNGPTFGLAMEVMLHSGKYDLVHLFFEKSQRSGEALKSLTYRVLVRTYWKEGKIDEAVRAVRDMERRGVIGTASVYYELARCLCYHGRWQHAMVEVEKLMNISHHKPLEITFTGMIKSAMDGGQIDDCMSIFKHMRRYCDPNIGTVNAMLKAYSQYDMFSNAKQLFEETKRAKAGLGTSPDMYTYGTMLEACARSQRWEDFDYVYREMTLSGHHIDQSKHALLIAEASQAGKWHLLEHAFDSIIEAGETPHPSFFSEMVCQALAQQNCERAIAVVHSMADAQFQLSDVQWWKLLWSNRDRIGMQGFQKLLAALHKLDAANEPTLASLFSSLRAVGQSCASKCPSGSIDGKRNGISTMVSSSDEGSTSVSGEELEFFQVDGAESELLSGGVGDLPPAHEILAAWKETRQDDEQ